MKKIFYLAISALTIGLMASCETEKPVVPVLGEYSYTDEEGSYSLFLSVNPDDPTDYIIQEPSGLPDGSKWHMTYDAAAKTLTCEGLEVGYEEYENQFGFGVVYGWYNKANLYTYGYLSFMENTDGQGDDPLVFNLDDNGYIIGIQNILFGGYVYQSDADGNPQKGLGWGYLLDNETVIEYVGPAAPNAPARAEKTFSLEKLSLKNNLFSL